jgi:hypothetical protein
MNMEKGKGKMEKSAATDSRVELAAPATQELRAES